MRLIAISLSLFGAMSLSLSIGGCAGDRSNVEPPDRCTLAIRKVSLIPMSVPGVLPDRTVLFRDDRISSVGKSSELFVDHCARIVDGTGKFLLPGFNDMHVHLPTTAFAQAFGLPANPVDFDAAIVPYLAHGITGIRVMSGAPDILEVRDSGDNALRPQMSVASPMLSGEPPVMPEPLTRIVRTPAQGRDAVREFARHGYDFIKVRDNLEPHVFRAVIDAADDADLYVDGHVVKTLNIDEVLASGQRGFAHIDNLVLAMKDEADDTRRFAVALQRCACFVTTALAVDQSAQRQVDDYEAALAREGAEYVPPLLREAFWKKPNNPYTTGSVPQRFFGELLERGKRLTRALSDAGINILAGSDALNPMVAPGIGLHEELAILVDAGLSPQQALSTATVNTAMVPGFRMTGAIVPGRYANALLVSTNPLNDITVLRRPEAVILKGRLLEREQLDRMLQGVARDYGTGR